MITYPSTPGVFEKDIMKITKIIHDNGGQVYGRSQYECSGGNHKSSYYWS